LTSKKRPGPCQTQRRPASRKYIDAQTACRLVQQCAYLLPCPYHLVTFTTAHGGRRLRGFPSVGKDLGRSAENRKPRSSPHRRKAASAA
jgi:hypothetical protein